MTRRSGWSVALLAVAAAVPSLVSGARALRGGWVAVIDNSVIAVRTHDALTAHPPLVGVYTMLTVAARSHVRLHHPGPLQFWLFAVPARLGGPEAGGLVVAAAVVNALAATGIVWAGHRLGGLRVAALAAGLVALLTWSLGGQILHDPWNAHVVLLPFAFLLLACCNIATGDLLMLPFAAFAASFVVESDLPFLVLASAVVVWSLVCLGVTLRARRARLGVEERLDLRRQTVRAVVIAGAVAVVCWSGPIADQIAGSGNFGALIRAGLGNSGKKLGPRIALRDLVHATSLPPAWLPPVTTVTKPDTPPGWGAIATAVLVLVALVGVTIWGWRTRHRRVAAVGSIALVALLGGMAITATVPMSYRYTQYVYPRRPWWPVGAFVWFALAYGLAVIVADRLARRRDAGSRQTGSWAFAPLAAGLAVLLVALVTAWPRLGPAQDYGSGGFGAVRALSSAGASAVRRGGPWLLRSEGGFAETIVGPGVASSLIYRGRDVVVPNSNFPDFGAQHFAGPGRRPAGDVLVVSGPTAGQARPGYRLVARWDPATAKEPYRGYRQSVLLITVAPVALYVSSGATTTATVPSSQR